MPKPLFINNFKVTTVTDVLAAGTSIVLSSGAGASIPVDGSGDYVLLTLTDGTNVEIVKATNVVGDTVTIARAQDSTTASDFLLGTIVYASIPAEIMTDLVADVIANTTATGTATSDIAAIVTVNNGQTTKINTLNTAVNTINDDLIDRILIDPAGNILTDPNGNVLSIPVDTPPLT